MTKTVQSLQKKMERKQRKRGKLEREDIWEKKRNFGQIQRWWGKGKKKHKTVEKAKWRWIYKEFGVTKPEKLPCQQWEMGSLWISTGTEIHQFRKGRKHG